MIPPFGSNPKRDDAVPSPEQIRAIEWRKNRYRVFAPRPASASHTPNPRPAHWDEGQIAENGSLTYGDWQAIDAAHDAMRSCFPRSTPPYQPGERKFTEEVPPTTARKLQPVDAENPVNFQASVRALASIRPADLFIEGAVFVGRDANRAILTKHHDGTYWLSYFDSGVSKPWKTATYDSLESAVVAVTGRQLYFYGHR